MKKASGRAGYGHGNRACLCVALYQEGAVIHARFYRIRLEHRAHGDDDGGRVFLARRRRYRVAAIKSIVDGRARRGGCERNRLCAAENPPWGCGNRCRHGTDLTAATALL